MIKNLLLIGSVLLVLTCKAGINLGTWSTFNTTKVHQSEKRAKFSGLNSFMLTGTFSCALTQTNPNCVETQNYLPGLQGAISQGQLAPSLFCFTLLLSGVDVTANFQDVYCNNPGALPSGIVVLPINVSTYDIIGSQSAAANSIVNYSYPTAVGNYYAWNVVNGTIISGQGTGSITVQWSTQCGIVQVVEFVDGICPAPTVCSEVQIVGTNCVYPGCTQLGACNYDPYANSNDGSCLFPNFPCDDLNPNTVSDTYNSNCECVGFTTVIAGCIWPNACNYNPNANQDDGSCVYPGCLDVLACNYDAFAGCSGNCEYQLIDFLDCQGACLNDSDVDGICDENETPGGCTNITACNYDPLDLNPNDDTCIFGAGCVIPGSCNYDINALCDNGTCVPSGCTDSLATNYNSLAGCDDGGCIYLNVLGCTDPLACNYNENANLNDSSCVYLNAGVISGNANPLIGDTVIYTTPFTPGVIYNWTVSGGGNTISIDQNSVTVQWNNTGNFAVELTVTSGACSETTTFNVNVDCNFPAINIIGDQSIQNNEIITFSTGMIAGGTYNWVLQVQPAGSANIISGAGTNVIQVQFESNFISATLSVTVGDGTCTDSFSITLTDLIEIEEDLESVILFPNPANESITIAGIDASANLTYHISDLSGRWVASGVLRNAQINLNDLAASTYLLELRSNGLPIARRRFMKN